MRQSSLSVAVLSTVFCTAAGLVAQHPREATFTPDIPRVWDPAALAAIEVPLAQSDATPQHLTPEQYYSMPVRPIHASYPIYHPDREPDGYFEQLLKEEPRVVWDRSSLTTKADWIRAGEAVFDAPIRFETVLTLDLLRDPEWYDKTQTPLLPNGVMPFARYVVREKGKVEVGSFSCAMCHSRVMQDGSLLKGAQGSFPFERAVAEFARDVPPRRVQAVQRFFFDTPWIDCGDEPRLSSLPKKTILRLHAAMPAGVVARQGASPRHPTQIPDLIGVRDRLYLDHTGVQRQHGIGDMMRYAALNQGATELASFAGFRPAAVLGSYPALDAASPDGLVGRYTDDALYALALFIYSLEPPPNPHPTDGLAQRGEEVFRAERCDRCHEPPLYTNNRLTPALGFDVSDDHPDASRIMKRSVGTDPGLATKTRRGTGLYKVPSLRGVWYRSAFGHDGSVRTLEEWLDPRRLRDDFEPSGWSPPGVTRRAVRGHEFGLDLEPDDRAALIAFLRTL